MAVSQEKVEYLDLWEAYKGKGSQEARKELILNYLPLVKYQVERVKMIIPDFIEEDDLESYGIIGLIDAIEKYDYRLGIKFNTYASRRIRGSIIDHLRKLDWLPHSLRREGKELQKVADKLAKELGRKPTVAELANKTNISREKVTKIYSKLNSAKWVSLYEDWGESTVFNFIKGDCLPPDRILDKKERIKLLARAIDRLSESERTVISLYYYEELTQKEIAEVMGLSPARISQIHKRAVYRLRGYLARRKYDLL
ncbi:sigma-70 family RNA polymerase sigma factor [Halothermothrix orenii]|uniref:RNA polymerase, sigma 28 subunit, FliA/WhiG n=1 Tax=Halothermothrix orenii (strain H 168 / OCM 544 / DSM 9562) TaxID=373903 RepID=B8CYP4_HALOH|nr:FliA/WhiG family RNA polymerase sigma factor [Halothermothrix orenii]ACL70413.1 RNA polymerase, sigma 28 subunit, FliA/WhiG [Halothermothrix orenii H 168]